MNHKSCESSLVIVRFKLCARKTGYGQHPLIYLIYSLFQLVEHQQEEKFKLSKITEYLVYLYHWNPICYRDCIGTHRLFH